MLKNDELMLPDIFVDLDSILDTRLPILSYLDIDLTKRIIADGSYMYRLKDSFGNIGYDAFTSIYKNRDKSVLKIATLTNVINFIQMYIVEAKAEAVMQEYKKTIKMYVNTYPYNLLEEEQELLKKAITSIMKQDIEIYMVYMDYEQLTPKWVNDNVALLIMYDGIHWLEYQNAYGRLKKIKLNTTALFIPTLLYDTSAITAKKKEELAELFSKMEEGYMSLIRLKFLSTETFCSVIAENGDRYRK